MSNSPDQNIGRPASRAGVETPEQTLADTPSPLQPDGQTLVAGTVAIAPLAADADSSHTVTAEESPHQPSGDTNNTVGDQTLADAQLSHSHSTHGREDQQTIFDPALTAEPTSGTDQATIGDPALINPVSANADISSPDQTFVESSEAAVSGTVAMFGGESARAVEVDRTLALPQEQNTLGGPNVVSAAADDCTIVEGSVDDDLTHVAGAPAKSDQTVLESEIGGSEAEATLVTQESSGDSRGSRPIRTAASQKRKGVHETADRWQYEQRYALVSNFARGGLGQIWLANDSRLRREVAYKEMLPQALKNRTALERFLEEAQITGQLEHPGIVPIYDIGYQPNGAPFYAMKFVRGETLEKTITAFHEIPKDHPEREIRFRKLLKNFLDICNAIAFAHDRGVLHRDLKPLNVMIGAFGETLVLDWGLAKVLGEPEIGEDRPITTSTAELDTDGATVIETQSPSASVGASQASASVGAQTQVSKTVTGTKRVVLTDVRSVGSQTMMGSVMGTPAYMPPEQALGKLDELDARSDIYSLGGILYKLLTNQQPIEKGHIKDVLQHVIDNKIIHPRQHDPSCPAPLAAICLKAMAKDRNDRYQSALQMATDIEAWMADAPVSCFEDPWRVKLRRWARKHQTAVTTTSVAVIFLVVVGVGARIAHNLNVSRLHNVAQTAMDDAEQAANEGDFLQGRQVLIEAIGRVADVRDLEDLKQTLVSRLELIESQRLQKLRREAESKLQTAGNDIDQGLYDQARTTLAQLNVLLSGEAALAELSSIVKRRLATVDAAIAERDEIAATVKRFTQFQTIVDEARARGSLLEDADADAAAAMEAGRKALDLFDLDQPQPLATTPKHFSQELHWTKEFHSQHGKWPLDALREDTFEVYMTLAESEVTLARQLDEKQREAAAKRALDLINRAESLGIRSQALLGRRAVYLDYLGRRQDFDKAVAAARSVQAQTGLDFYLLGEEMRKRAQHAEALNFYLKAQQIDPKHYWVQHCTGLSYLQIGQSAGAISCFSTCIALRPNYVWPHMLRGAAYAGIRDFESAHKDFAQAIKLAPELYNIYVNRGAAFLWEKRYQEAIQDFRKAGELNPKSTIPLTNLAQVYFEMADALRNDQDQSLPEIELAAKEQEYYELAAAAIQQAVEVAPLSGNADLYQRRARIALRQANTTLALTNYEKHIELERNPQFKAASHNAIGRIHFAAGRFEQALAAFTEAQRLAPDDPDNVYRIGETHLQLRQYEPAAAHFERFQRMMNLALEDRVSNPEVLYSGLATAFNARGRKREAIEYYTLALLFDRNQAVPLAKRGWAYLTDSERLAKQDFEEAVRANPDDPDTLIGLAYACTKLREWPDAIKHVGKGVELARQQVPQAGSEGWKLFFNAATVYSQCCIPYLQKPMLSDAEQESQEALVAKSVALLAEAHQLASKDPGQKNLMLASLRADEALIPIYRFKAFQDFARQVLPAAGK